MVLSILVVRKPVMVIIPVLVTVIAAVAAVGALAVPVSALSHVMQDITKTAAIHVRNVQLVHIAQVERGRHHHQMQGWHHVQINPQILHTRAVRHQTRVHGHVMQDIIKTVILVLIVAVDISVQGEHIVNLVLLL